MKNVQSLLEEAKTQFVFSGYQLAGDWAGDSFSLHGGMTSYWPEGTKMQANSLFDIGSLTKVVATTSLLARAVDQKKLALEDSIGKWIPEFKGTPYETIPVSDFLCHSAGMKWWHPLYLEAEGTTLLSVLKREQSTFCEAKPGVRALYSDIDFWILGLVLERACGKLLPHFHAEVVKPLGLKVTTYGPVEAKSSVATEYCLHRRRILHGEVFDENAAFLGGVCAHAGLFSTAEDLVTWAKAWRDALEGNSQWISSETAQRFSKPVGRIVESTWALGWDTKSPKDSSAGNFLSLRSFGHLGYPGCSVWIDPDVGAVVVFLSNRIHPSRLDERIRALRPRVHDAVALNFSRPKGK